MPEDSSLPPYLVIATALEAEIRSGRLAPGARLPSLTRLSQEYEVAKNTVVKAIELLKSKGLVKSQQGWGNFVSNPVPEAESLPRVRLPGCLSAPCEHQKMRPAYRLTSCWRLSSLTTGRNRRSFR